MPNYNPLLPLKKGANKADAVSRFTSTRKLRKQNNFKFVVIINKIKEKKKKD
jgi:hypothetical protein